MSTQLTSGRYRRLKTTSTTSDRFAILAFDQRGSYRRMLPTADYDQLTQIKREIIGALAPHTSAVLTDPIYGLGAAMAMSGQAGLLLAIEKSGYSGDDSARTSALLPHWSAAKIARIGGSAVKLMVYYHPHHTQLAEQIEQFARDVAQQCHACDLPLFLEPMSYSIDPAVSKDSAEFVRTRPQIITETAARLSQTGADVLKLEFPHDIRHSRDRSAWQRACRQLSDASPIPWVLLSAGVDFADFESQLAAACENGASGFLAGRAIWKEAAAMSTAERAAFLSGTARTRLAKLHKITAQARPWTDFYHPPADSPTAYESYG